MVKNRASQNPCLVMILDDPRLPDFLAAQSDEAGGNLQLDPSGLWLLFVVPAVDAETNQLARALLSSATFAYEVGESEDDCWTLYYVDSTNRPAAVHWLEDLGKQLTGEIRPASPAHRALINDVIASSMPHRVAQRLGEAHARGEVGAGVAGEPAVVRALLDRLHQREPLFFSAFQTLLAQHLIDMIVLLQKIIVEDIELLNEIVRGSIARDPLMKARQDAAIAIRHGLTRFHVINPLDQQKNIAIANPYAAYLEIVRRDEQISATIDANVVPIARPNFIIALKAVRRVLYRGQKFGDVDTQAPWMNNDIAYSFRFIRQRLESRRELAPMDGLYMLQRAVEV